MLAPETIVLAARRWLRLLRFSTLGQASEIIRAGAEYADLTHTQYASALDWLTGLEALSECEGRLELRGEIKALPEEELGQWLFQRILERGSPAWLPDADILVREPNELPEDASVLAELLGLSESTAFVSIRQVRGRIDLAERARVGAAGELAVVELLEKHWPGSTTHVALTDDGYGYDVIFRPGKEHWHLEVKSTTRRGRLAVHLTRHEYEVGLRDPCWRLIVVGLDAELRPQGLATLRHAQVLGRSPKDACADATWQSAAHELTRKDLERGMSFVYKPVAEQPFLPSRLLFEGCAQGLKEFSWLP